MLPVISLLILAFAVSLDGFGVGVMYGLRKIRIPLLSVGIISLWSGIIIYVSMQIGVLMAAFLSPEAARRVGAAILIGIGVWALYQMRQQKQGDSAEAEGPVALAAEVEAAAREAAAAAQRVKEIVNIELKRFGLVIQILRTPSMADVDRSGNISASEATLLGLALSMDAFGAGIGAALIGYEPVLTASVIALASGTFIATGLRVGLRFAEKSWMKKLSILPGCVLILMGLMKML
ncbi:MntP/YtaF family protein [Paenibacillus athensensis]|uniref:Sporulation membrane protein YtaF n=1 Tax=Paenibacillus athensensis TaxID=1967502 RepID=A0A4Y8Q980_9BACL|nr:MntP/YtaF family protein [Paenibacillus athensensis]MCD1258952.1 MntP/YtaF family protein [Paenibacillus athensensis]